LIKTKYNINLIKMIDKNKEKKLNNNYKNKKNKIKDKFNKIMPIINEKYLL